MATVMTVTGAKEPSQLGVTYAHEHLLGSPPDWSPDRQDRDLTMLSVEAAVKELEIFKLAGGQAIVFTTHKDMRGGGIHSLLMSFFSEQMTYIASTGLGAIHVSCIR